MDGDHLDVVKANRDTGSGLQGDSSFKTAFRVFIRAYLSASITLIAGFD